MVRKRRSDGGGHLRLAQDMQIEDQPAGHQVHVDAREDQVAEHQVHLEMQVKIKQRRNKFL